MSLKLRPGYDIFFDADQIGEFVSRINETEYISGTCSGIGIKKNGEVIGGVLYCQYNGSSVWVHVAGIGNWLDRTLLWYIFDYPFRQLNVNQLLGSVDGNNEKAIRFDEHLGFERKAVIPLAGKGDSDLIIYSLKRESCRWWNEQTKNPGSTGLHSGG